MAYDLRDKYYLIGFTSNQIVSCGLPTKQQVLAVLFYNLRTVGIKDVTECANLTIDETLLFWKKALIPTQEKKKCVKKLKSLYENLRKLKRNEKRKTKTQITNEDQFKNDIKGLFDIAHANAMELINNDDDKQFLLKYRGESLCIDNYGSNEKGKSSSINNK